jgi:predicted aldo/keto reductase-like oxidoreductase
MAEKYLGESTGKLGFGYMRLPTSGKEFDFGTIDKMVDAFLDAGFTYFDTAFIYPGAEEAMCKTLVKRHPRDKYTIATKMQLMMVNEPEEMQKIFDTQLQRLGTGYIDFYLLHALGAELNKKAEAFGAWEFLKRLKAEGKIRHYGFSCHDTPENLDALLTRHPDAEFVQLQINYLDWENKDVQSRGVYEVARRHNKPVVIMEPLKGGLLAGGASPINKVLKAADPDASTASWGVRFAASLDGVITMLSGMNSMAQLQDNISTVKNLKPLSESELKTIHDAVNVLNSVQRVPCTGCRYCVENCPQQINIPALMDLYNTYLVHQSTANSDFPFFLATKDGGKPSSCVACRSCEEHCPQHITVSDILGKMVPLYES